MEDQEALISQFAAISGADNERAKFYLESAAWNLESALSSFYEEGEEESPAEPLGVRPEAEGAPTSPQQASAQPTQPSRINMIGQDSESSDDEGGQAFYAGGSTHSGQQVLGPPKKKSDVVAKLFKSAKEHGAEVVEGSKEGKKGRKAVYGGTGYRLGETNDDTQVIPAAAKVESEEPRDVSLKMWRTGFTVDDGPLRSYEDPSNAEFLGAIRRGEIPLELIREARGGEVYINMADHRHEDYSPPKATLKAFSGSGHSLGSPAPAVLGQVVHPPGATGGACRNTAISAPVTDPKAAEKKAQEDLKLNSGEPTTNIQIRLPDASRLIIKLNHTHSVGDIRQYIVTSRPSYETTEFALMTTFPHAELTNLSQSVADAKLLNAALVVKPK